MAVVLTLGLFTEPLPALAQTAVKVWRIGFLSWLGCSDDPFLKSAFRDGLRQLGYVEGRNVVIECRSAPGKPERFPKLATELLSLNVDILVAVGTDLALAAKQTTRQVPIVFVYVADPVASGLVNSLARPGANVTGLSMLASEISQKAVEVLKEINPSMSRLTVLLDSRNLGQASPYRQLAAAAKAAGVDTQQVDVRNSADLDAAFAAMLSQRAQALYVYPLPITSRDFQRLAAFAIKNKLPAATHHPPYVAGLLLSYAADIMKQFHRSGIYVDRIFKGAKPAELPVEQPDEFQLTINLKTAKAMGLQIPQSLLGRANEVIK